VQIKYEILQFHMVSNFLQLHLALLAKKLPTFYRIWGTFTNYLRSPQTWHKFGVCPHTVLHNTFLLRRCLSLQSVYIFSFRASSPKCCVNLLYVIKRDTYPARFILLGSLKCKKKRSLNFRYISPSEKKTLKMYDIVFLIIQR
jgi:hypothetical protein